MRTLREASTRTPPARVRWMRGATLAYAGVLVLLSVLPSDPHATGGLWAWDRSIRPAVQNVLHVPAYAVLAAMAVAARCRPGGWRGAAAVAAGSAAFGALLECVQAFVPGRSGSLGDTTWNLVGAVAGALAATAFVRSAAGRRIVGISG